MATRQGLSPEQRQGINAQRVANTTPERRFLNNTQRMNREDQAILNFNDEHPDAPIERESPWPVTLKHHPRHNN